MTATAIRKRHLNSEFALLQTLSRLFHLVYFVKCIKVPEKKKKVVVLCSRPRQNVNLGTFTLYMRNSGKEMYKTCVMHVESCCFANINLSLFCRSRCRYRRRCWSSLIGTLRFNDAMATRTSLKRWICVPLVFIAIVPTYLLCQKGKPSWGWISRDQIQVQK